jgi:putative ABC transport system permease protein
MSLIRRAVLNLVRSPLRTVAVTLLLAVSIGLALIMATVHGATQSQMGSISGRIGTSINITPYSSGGPGGFEQGTTISTLSDNYVDQLSSIEHVTSVEPSIRERYNGTALQAYQPSSSDQASNSDSSFPGGRRFTPGITVMGVDPEVSISDLTGTLNNASVTLSEGRYFTSDDDSADVVLISQDLAQTNSLDVGSTVDIESTSATVIGIYSTSNGFAANMLVMPVETVKTLYGLDGVNSVTVIADDASNVDAVVAAINSIFPSGTADVTSAKDQYERISGNVSSTRSTATIAMIVAFIVAGAIVLFSVVLMVRQRVKEIGIMKAIGASNWRIGFQFSLETLAVSVVGAFIGALITYPLAQKVADLMNGTSSTTSGGTAGRGFGGDPGGIFSQVGGRIAGLHVAVSPTVFLYALLIAAALAILASTLPAWYIARVKPAEVLRNE